MAISGVSSVTSGYAASTLRPAATSGSSRASGTPDLSGAPDASAPTGSPAAREPGAQPQQTKPGELSKAEQAQVRALQDRDRDVRQHEQAHLAASGGLATSGAIYSFKVGPDGIAYAVGGEVNINVAPGRTPQETIARAEIVRAAALAPADPSGQDRAVAAQAAKMEADARAELATQRSQQFDSASKQQSKGIDQYQKIAGDSGALPGSNAGAVDVFA